MLKNTEQKVSSYRIDLVALESDGSFQCPKCGMQISPEDETEKNYQIIDTKFVNNELVELIVACSKCGTKIMLTGFNKS